MGGFVFSLSTDRYHGPFRILVGLIYLFAFCSGRNRTQLLCAAFALEVLRYEWETEVALRRSMETASFDIRNITVEDLPTIEEMKGCSGTRAECNSEGEASRILSVHARN